MKVGETEDNDHVQLTRGAEVVGGSGLGVGGPTATANIVR